MTDHIEMARINADKWEYQDDKHHAIARAQEGTTWAMIAIAEELRALRDVLKPATEKDNDNDTDTR